ncbi:MAG: relaxase MobL [Oscillospiraceae bacterium]|nr:relaxase MobL [Oscillospiraceae bacterium]
MALLIYKQWHKQPNIKSTPASNAQHVKYIGERAHVMKSEQCDNGLFGKFNEQRYGYKINMDEAMKYVNRLSKKGHTIFRSTVSFKPEIAQTLNLTDKISFEKYVKYHVHSMAKHNSIEIQNFEYLAAVHDKEGQPHFHVVFWDKAQSIGKNFANPLIGDDIRNELEEKAANELIAQMELPEGYEQNWKTNDEIRRNLIKQSFESAFNQEYDTQKNAQENITQILESNLNNFPKKLAKQYNKIYEERPRTGRNFYSFMSAEYKSQLDKFTTMLMENNPMLKAEYERMMTSHEAIAFALNSNSTNYGKLNIAKYLGKMQDKFYAKAGNSILRELKNIAQSKNEESENKDLPDMFVFTKCVLKAIKAVSPANNPQPHGEAPLLSGDLSKAARQDIFYKNRDKGIER